ncbi:UvrD-helicase domain-containing protein [Ralstonia sp. SM1864_UCD524_TZ4]|uniref:DNA 3'-5' helicase n=2 Tax=Ralstonia solanacearum TaxID=305 RepID=A0A0S4UW33_RALSL|nr:UvrD-helicase domain-containing protein [Ralstonia pseudosolanacearum]CUV26225.1 Helicase-related protein [Ralstonia solanacearum]CUV42579.1 Helicase-related protein [Ralstonia solanacearum]CUV60491.1 Helicase-related protein [Ralstonia solanacearum]
MDAIELARQRAAELHREAVRQGRDPWAPYDFAVAEAKSRNLTVAKCAPGTDALDGGRAFFDREARLILHEDAGFAFEQAFLVAHEIGHAELGDDEEDEGPYAIDPARTSEAAPVGLDRVVDYSHRQRREVQMDLFAREFLLPRPVVRELHLKQEMTCSGIASRLGAPFEVVAQQMLDALLLPSVTAEPPRQTPDIPLNEAQRQAAAHRGQPYLLQAGPGTGKTRTLVARVESLLDEGADPRRILLLTFSNRAAAEMAERLARTRPAAAAALWIGTFHRFGLDVLRRFHDQVDLPADPRLMDRTEAVELLEQEFPRLGLAHYRDVYDPSQVIADLLSAISRAKDEVVDAVRYRDLAQRMRDTATSSEAVEAAERALEVATVYEAYEELKRQAGCVDFGDLVLRPVQLLEANEALRQQLQQTYDHVLVDEYQDVNRSSVRLLNALKPDGNHLWVVGDGRQSIYRFRGASSFNISRFGREDFPGGIAGYLEHNYRSVPQIVDTFSTFAVGMRAGGTHSRLEADRASGGTAPELRVVATGDLTSAALAENIEQMRLAGSRYSDQAVLCRGNDKLSELGQELERLGIPVLFLGSLFERQEVKDLMAFLSLLTDRRAMGLVRIACWPEFAMSLEDVVRVFEHLRTTEATPGNWTTLAPHLSPSGQSALGALATALAGFNASANPWTVLATVLLDRTRVAARIASSSQVADQAQGIAIWQFLNFVRIQPSGQGLPITRLMDRIRRLLRLRDDRDLRQLPAAAQGIDAVRLMTIHGAKGLEFPVVHLTGANKDSIPGAYRPPKCPPPDGMIAGAAMSSEEAERDAQAQEQECLFYVAMSRARDRLFLYAAQAKGNGHRRPLSEFVHRLGALRQISVSPALRLTPAPDTVPLPVVFSGPVSFSAQAAALYESCPRRFLYTHLLQVGGRRQATAFMKMHEAVRSVCQAVIDSGQTHDWESRLAAALVAHELHEHGYATEYRAIATAMLQFFLASRDGVIAEPTQALSLTFDDEQILVRPDEILVKDGVRTLRTVRTGHAPNKEPKDVGTAAVLLATQRAFPGAIVELVYLADRQIKSLDLTPKQLAGSHSKLGGMLADIRAGHFAAERSEYICPGCPAFFICGPTPPGTLHKTF